MIVASRMSIWQTIFEKLLAALMIALAVITLAAAILLMIGSRTANLPLRYLGEWLSLPAVLAAMLPVVAGATLLTIWGVRGAYRLMTWPQPLESLSSGRSEKVSKIGGLSDEEILRLLQSRKESKNAANWTVTGAKDDADENGPQGTASPTDSPATKAAKRGIPCEALENGRSNRITVPATASAEIFEAMKETLTDFVEQGQQLVIDCRAISKQALQQLCDCLVSITNKFGKQASTALRVATSFTQQEILDVVWGCLRQYTTELAPEQVFLLGAAVLTLFLGDPMPPSQMA